MYIFKAESNTCSFESRFTWTHLHWGLTSCIQILCRECPLQSRMKNKSLHSYATVAGLDCMIVEQCGTPYNHPRLGLNDPNGWLFCCKFQILCAIIYIYIYTFFFIYNISIYIIYLCIYYIYICIDLYMDYRCVYLEYALLYMMTLLDVSSAAFRTWNPKAFPAEPITVQHVFDTQLLFELFFRQRLYSRV